MARKKTSNPKRTEAVALSEYAAKALVAAEQLRNKSRPVEALSLEDVERALLADLPGLAGKLKTKLAKKEAAFTVAAVASMVMAAGESFVDAEPKQQVALLIHTLEPPAGDPDQIDAGALRAALSRPRPPRPGGRGTP